MPLKSSCTHNEIKFIFSSELSNDSFALTLGYQINNTSMPEKTELRNETYKLIQDSASKLVSLYFVHIIMEYETKCCMFNQVRPLLLYLLASYLNYLFKNLLLSAYCLTMIFLWAARLDSLDVLYVSYCNGKKTWKTHEACKTSACLSELTLINEPLWPLYTMYFFVAWPHLLHDRGN